MAAVAKTISPIELNRTRSILLGLVKEFEIVSYVGIPYVPNLIPQQTSDFGSRYRLSDLLKIAYKDYPETPPMHQWRNLSNY